MSVVLVVTAFPVPERRAEVIAAFEAAIARVHDEPGVELYALHEGRDRLVMIEKYSSAGSRACPARPACARLCLMPAGGAYLQVGVTHLVSRDAAFVRAGRRGAKCRLVRRGSSTPRCRVRSPWRRHEPGKSRRLSPPIRPVPRRDGKQNGPGLVVT